MIGSKKPSYHEGKKAYHIVEDIIENLKGHSYYFVVDLKSGYNTVLLKDKSQDLTAFHAYNLGLMCLTSLPQGYTNVMIEFC